MTRLGEYGIFMVILLHWGRCKAWMETRNQAIDGTEKKQAMVWTQNNRSRSNKNAIKSDE